MTTFECPKCHQIFTRKASLERHIEGTKKCQKSMVKCNYCNLKFKTIFDLNMHQNTKCNSVTFLLSNLTDRVSKTEDNVKKDKKKIKLLKEKSKKKIKSLKEKNKLLEEKIRIFEENFKNIGDNQHSEGNIKGNKNIIKNNNSKKEYNIKNININLVKYNTEKMDHISEEEKLQILSAGLNSLPILVRKVHFNKNAPQYHNIRDADSDIEYWNGKKWKRNTKEKFIQKLISDTDDKYMDLENSEKLQKKLSKAQKEVIEKYSKKTSKSRGNRHASDDSESSGETFKEKINKRVLKAVEDGHKEITKNKTQKISSESDNE